MRKKLTTVDLTERAEKIKEQLRPIYGIKNILSAGLVLLAKLPVAERESAIADANGLSAEDIVGGPSACPKPQKQKGPSRPSKSA